MNERTDGHKDHYIPPLFAGDIKMVVPTEGSHHKDYLREIAKLCSKVISKVKVSVRRTE